MVNFVANLESNKWLKIKLINDYPAEGILI